MADQEAEPVTANEDPSGAQEQAQGEETTEVVGDETQNNENAEETIEAEAEAAETEAEKNEGEAAGTDEQQGADNTAQEKSEEIETETKEAEEEKTETETKEVEEEKTDPPQDENQNNNADSAVEEQGEAPVEEKPDGEGEGEEQEAATEKVDTEPAEADTTVEETLGASATDAPEIPTQEATEEPAPAQEETKAEDDAEQEKEEEPETKEPDASAVAQVAEDSQDLTAEDATANQEKDEGEGEVKVEKSGDSQETAAEEQEKSPKEGEEDSAEKPQEEDVPTDDAKAEEETEQSPAANQGPGGDEAADEKEAVVEDEKTQVDTNTSAKDEGNVKTSEVPATSTAFQALDTRHGVNLEATATVKLMLMPSGQVVTIACTLGKTLESLKAHFASELKMSSALIMMTFDGKGMSDSTTLADLGVGPNGTVQLELQSADPVNNPLKPYRPRQEYHMPDVITVRVVTEICESRDVVVEIERSRTKKPFLGGFRNKITGVEFHNASAQTLQKPRPLPTAERFCRDTQTCEQKNTRQQTTNTTSTQMTGVGVYISLAEDKLVTPGKYFCADDYWALVLSKVIILQKYYRRWLAKRYVKKLREDKAKRLEWERQEELRKKKEKESRLKKEYARRINPKTKADFDMLLHCLEKWRQEEMERINAMLDGAERKAAMCMLLEQETELLSAIERHKNEANLDNRDKRIMQFLEKAASPKKWQGHDGKLTYMDTPYTIRAKELRDIYNSINMKYLTQDERLDVLLTLKHTVKEHDCKLTQEIIELIDREADLLMRGVKEGNLTGLRKRISTLFLQYIKTPTFNPEAAKLLKVPQDPSTLRKNINYCHSCGNYLPSTEFFITSNSRTVGRCRNCVKVENDGRQREDHSYYRIILKALRKSEEAMQDGSSICYLLQENDLRYLVENIWSNQSMLSAWDDLYDLVLVRWDKHQEWSPWNCILLTHDEAEAHKKLFSLEEGYGHVFIHKVTQKHNFARNYFSRLPGMAEVLRQKAGSRDLPSGTNGPSVAGHSVPKAQKV
ncbi:hypothetical protein EGW08_006224 [Elysia chlorotica]|uniref:Ubiquitin-like domain-containing protein n=1 Tax=Elysia chlorotica TaxID=188477 RepID=A0A433TWV7_ELYCH|nr:hypothetical protein EGW08_006224 [Elysia chlorotica]